MLVDRVLLGLRLAGFTDAERLARTLDGPMVGLAVDAAGIELARLERQGWARFRDGRAAGVLSGWSLSPSGRAEVHRQLAAELDVTGCRAAVESAYHRFLDLNPELLEAMTDWQVRGGVVNDHADRRYDRRVLTRLERINEKISPVLVELTACLDRFGSYRTRLDTAMARTRAGEPAYVDRPMIDSYHTVWFELHENLLTTLGLDRSQEPRPSDPPRPTSEVS
jgi:hypothetical protein